MALPIRTDHWNLIGVDGGATKVRAQRVVIEDLVDSEPLMHLSGTAACRLNSRSPEFRPVAMERQLAEHEAGEYCLAEDEARLGAEWVRGFAECIAEALAEDASPRGSVHRGALVGIAMAGWKTRDGRGIGVLRNGPRIPDFADRLESELERRDIVLGRPLSSLASDGLCRGMGEEFGGSGSLRGTKDAYYVAGGSGVAEALKLGGRLVGMEQVDDWLLRAWQLRSAHGISVEDAISASGINAEVARRHSLPADPRAPHLLPEVSALEGDQVARDVLTQAAVVLAELVMHRIAVVHGGKKTRLGFGETHRDLRGNHPYVGTILDRVVLGGRLGRFHANEGLQPWFRGPFEERLAELVRDLPDPTLRGRLLEGRALRPGFVQASTQARSAVMGAACVAWREAEGRRR